MIRRQQTKTQRRKQIQELIESQKSSTTPQSPNNLSKKFILGKSFDQRGNGRQAISKSFNFQRKQQNYSTMDNAKNSNKLSVVDSIMQEYIKDFLPTRVNSSSLNQTFKQQPKISKGTSQDQDKQQERYLRKTTKHKKNLSGRVSQCQLKKIQVENDQNQQSKPRTTIQSPRQKDSSNSNFDLILGAKQNSSEITKSLAQQIKVKKWINKDQVKFHPKQFAAVIDSQEQSVKQQLPFKQPTRNLSRVISSNQTSLEDLAKLTNSKSESQISFQDTSSPPIPIVPQLRLTDREELPRKRTSGNTVILDMHYSDDKINKDINQLIKQSNKRTKSIVNQLVKDKIEDLKEDQVLIGSQSGSVKGSLNQDGPEEANEIIDGQTGVVKNRAGQIIQKHTVDFSNLQTDKAEKQTSVPSITENTESVKTFEQSEPKQISVTKIKWHRNKKYDKMEGTKSLGVEFFSFLSLRNKVNQVKDSISSDKVKSHKTQKNQGQHVNFKRRSSTKLIEKIMSKQVSVRMQTFYENQKTQSLQMKQGQQIFETPLEKSVKQEGQDGSRQNSSLLVTERTPDQQSSSPNKHKTVSDSTSSLTSSLITSYNDDEDEKLSSKSPVKFSRKNRQSDSRHRRASTVIPAMHYWRKTTQLNYESAIMELRKKLKVSGTAVDLDKFKEDIQKRKNMLTQLNDQARKENVYLKNTNKLKYRAVSKLADLNNRYNSLILNNILLIQKWWRACKSRIFFTTIVRKDILNHKNLHQEKLLDMELTVIEQEKQMKIRLVPEETKIRDPMLDLLEKKHRELYQKNKSNAIMKFEMHLSKMLEKSLAQSTLNVLKEVKKPIFNKELEQFIDKLGKYYQSDITLDQITDSALTGQEKKSKVVFEQTIEEKLNLNQANKFNEETEAAQSHKAQIEQEIRSKLIARIQTLVKQPTGLSQAFQQDSYNKLMRKTSILNKSQTNRSPNFKSATITNFDDINRPKLNFSSAIEEDEPLSKPELIKRYIDGLKTKQHNKQKSNSPPKGRISPNSPRRDWKNQNGRNLPSPEMKRTKSTQGQKDNGKSSTNSNQNRKYQLGSQNQKQPMKIRKNASNQQKYGLDPITEFSRSDYPIYNSFDAQQSQKGSSENLFDNPQLRKRISNHEINFGRSPSSNKQKYTSGQIRQQQFRRNVSNILSLESCKSQSKNSPKMIKVKSNIPRISTVINQTMKRTSMKNLNLNPAHRKSYNVSQPVPVKQPMRRLTLNLYPESIKTLSFHKNIEKEASNPKRTSQKNSMSTKNSSTAFRSKNTSFGKSYTTTNSNAVKNRNVEFTDQLDLSLVIEDIKEQPTNHLSIEPLPKTTRKMTPNETEETNKDLLSRTEHGVTSNEALEQQQNYDRLNQTTSNENVKSVSSIQNKGQSSKQLKTSNTVRSVSQVTNKKKQVSSDSNSLSYLKPYLRVEEKKKKPLGRKNLFGDSVRVRGFVGDLPGQAFLTQDIDSQDDKSLISNTSLLRRPFDVYKPRGSKKDLQIDENWSNHPIEVIHRSTGKLDLENPPKSYRMPSEDTHRQIRKRQKQFIDEKRFDTRVDETLGIDFRTIYGSHRESRLQNMSKYGEENFIEQIVAEGMMRIENNINLVTTPFHQNFKELNEMQFVYNKKRSKRPSVAQLKSGIISKLTNQQIRILKKRHTSYQINHNLQNDFAMKGKSLISPTQLILSLVLGDQSKKLTTTLTSIDNNSSSASIESPEVTANSNVYNEPRPEDIKKGKKFIVIEKTLPTVKDQMRFYKKQFLPQEEEETKGKRQTASDLQELQIESSDSLKTDNDLKSQKSAAKAQSSRSMQDRGSEGDKSQMSNLLSEKTSNITEESQRLEKKEAKITVSQI